jgi:hypothetical protein
MIPAIPWYITLVVLLANVAIAAGIWMLLASGTRRSGLAPAAQRGVGRWAALFLGAWLGIALLLGPAIATLRLPARFPIAPVVPFAVAVMVIALMVLGGSSALRRAIGATPLPALVGVQVYRTIGVTFLVLLAQGKLPAHFALPAGWGDIAIGLAAPFVALAIARGYRGAAMSAVVWNLVGLLDLVVAVGMGTGYLVPLLAPELGPHVLPAAAMQAFPMIIVPAFAVPMSVLLHVVALGRLLSPLRPGSELVPRPAR